MFHVIYAATNSEENFIEVTGTVEFILILPVFSLAGSVHRIPCRQHSEQLLFLAVGAGGGQWTTA